MKAFRQRRQIKRSYFVVTIFIAIIMLTTFLCNIYGKVASSKITTVAESKLEKFTQSFLSNNIGYGILNNKNLENILIINKNKDGEILYVDYNLDKAYEALQIITDVLYENIRELENGKYKNIIDDDIISMKDGLALKVPMFIFSNNPLFASFGPDIYVKVSFVGSVVTNIKSQITNYGLNNALVELYVTINITEKLTTPVMEKELIFDYDVLVASKVINGRVPEVYGGLINGESNILNSSL